MFLSYERSLQRGLVGAGDGDGDLKALRAYHAGDRSSEMVAPYFERMGL
jgi:hypothetical protein